MSASDDSVRRGAEGQPPPDQSIANVWDAAAGARAHCDTP